MRLFGFGLSFSRMEGSEQIIEAEVLEIDGVSVDSRAVDSGASGRNSSGGWAGQASWRGKVRGLDSRFWPLWVFLGVVGVVLLVVVGMCWLVIFLIYKLCKVLVMGVVSLFLPVGELQRR